MPLAGAGSAVPEATPSLSDRQVMGNITTRTVLNPTNSVAQPEPSVKPPSLLDQLRLSNDGQLPTQPSSFSTVGMGGGGSPKKSILEQLGEIRAKQREIELRQMAKRQGSGNV